MRANASFHFIPQPAKKEGAAAPKEEVSLGPKVKEGEEVFAVAHIYASFNDTFVVSDGSPSTQVATFLTLSL
jgi:hypothetical protein